MTSETTVAFATAHPRLEGVPNPIRTVTELVAAWRTRHAWRLDLRRLDDHMLQDIGLSRADAEAEIAKPFWRR